MSTKYIFPLLLIVLDVGAAVVYALNKVFYKNEDRKCECYKCELNTACPYVDKYQRLGREHRGALGLCKKLEENQKRKE